MLLQVYSAMLTNVDTPGITHHDTRKGCIMMRFDAKITLFMSPAALQYSAN